MLRLNKSAWLLFLMTGLILLPACQGKSTGTPTPAPAVVYTAAAQTVQAELTRIAVTNHAAVTPTLAPTNAQTPTPEFSATPKAPAASPTPAFSFSPTLAPIVAGSNDICTLITQSVPDNTSFTPNAPFKESWELQNVGNTTWTVAGYFFKFTGDQQMSAPISVAIPQAVAPFERVEVTVSFTAPAAIGQYKSSWTLTNPSGTGFCPVFVIINVVSAPATAVTSTRTPTPGP